MNYLIDNYHALQDYIKQLRAFEQRNEAIEAETRIFYGMDREDYEERLQVDEALPYPVIITQFGHWAVTPEGLAYLGDSDYIIEWQALYTQDWIRHMSEKNWVDLSEFVPAYYHAKRIHGYLLKVGVHRE